MTAAPGTMLDAVVFEIGTARLGVPADAVREVVRAVAVSPLAGAPPLVCGAVRVRGELAAVIDLRAHFRIPPRALHPDEFFVVVRGRSRLLALRADRVLAVQALPRDAALDPRDASPAATPGTTLLPGPDGLLLVWDPESFLSHAEERSLAELLVAAERAGE